MLLGLRLRREMASSKLACYGLIMFSFFNRLYTQMKCSTHLQNCKYTIVGVLYSANVTDHLVM